MNGTSTADGVVRTEVVDGRILVITLNRPQSRNAINQEVALALGEAVERLNTDPELRVGILTGIGTAFCAGQDLKALSAGEAILIPGHADWGFGGFVGHYSKRPIIGAINGFAYGGGFELALACDLLVGSTEARFALPEVSRGLIAGGGGLPRVAQQLPSRIAARLAYTGDPITATEAERWGLLDQVVGAEELLPTAIALATRIAAQAPLAISTTKQLLTSLEQSSTWEPATWATVNDAFDAILRSEDAAEGATAFAEKRQPEWKNR